MKFLCSGHKFKFNSRRSSVKSQGSNPQLTCFCQQCNYCISRNKMH